LKEAGFVEGQNVSIEYRWAEGQSDRLSALAADLVQRHVSVIAALGGDLTALAAKAATSITPIVFMNGSDPVKSGLVTSINRPGGNVTGVSLFAGTVDAKRLELLHELVPQVSLVAALNNPLVAETEPRSKALADAAATMGLQLLFSNVSSDGEFDPTFANIASQGIRALFVSGSPFFVSQRNQLVPPVARYKIPAVYAWRENVAAGGLMSYRKQQRGNDCRHDQRMYPQSLTPPRPNLLREQLFSARLGGRQTKRARAAQLCCNCRRRKGNTAWATAPGSSANGQCPLSGKTFTSARGKTLALTLGEFNGDVGIVCAPDHQCGQVQRPQRFRELARSLFRIEGISIKPQHSALCTTIEGFVYMVEIFRW
jgi:ABC transporter substrate binding protein